MLDEGIRNAVFPFNHPSADVVIRSKDGFDFRVFKAIMSMASPFFTIMFSLKQLETDNTTDVIDEHGVQVILVPEDRWTLEMLLRSFHPMCELEVMTLEGIHSLLKAASKYEMTSVINRLRDMLIAPRFLETEPLRVFAIAYHYGLKPEYRKAAESTLLLSELGSDSKDLKYISAPVFYRLQLYRRECIRRIEQFFDGLGSWSFPADHDISFGDRLPAVWSWDSHNNTSWKSEYKRTALVAVQTRPCGATLRDLNVLRPALKALEELSELQMWSEALSELVDEEISRVTEEFKFDEEYS